MSIEILPTRSAPKRGIVGDGMTAKNSVRVYRCSPEDIQLQIRRDRDYVSITLTFVEALEVASMLVAAAKKA